MKVSYVEGIANHDGPESCGAAREGRSHVCLQRRELQTVSGSRRTYADDERTWEDFLGIIGAPYIVSAYANGLSPLLFQKYARMSTLTTAS